MKEKLYTISEVDSEYDKKMIKCQILESFKKSENFEAIIDFAGKSDEIEKTISKLTKEENCYYNNIETYKNKIEDLEKNINIMRNVAKNKVLLIKMFLRKRCIYVINGKMNLGDTKKFDAKGFKDFLSNLSKNKLVIKNIKEYVEFYFIDCQLDFLENLEKDRDFLNFDNSQGSEEINNRDFPSRLEINGNVELGENFTSKYKQNRNSKTRRSILL